MSDEKLEPTLSRPTSQRVTQAQFETDTFKSWARELGLPEGTYSRIHWEYVYLMRCLEDAGMLKPGKIGLGFGVGKEPTVRVMSRLGAEIVATDWRTDHWKDFYALSYEGLGIDQELQSRVRLMDVDMRDIPDEFEGSFDFVWSLCALEHLGGHAPGEEFFRNSLKCLKPGGVAVHTTELSDEPYEQPDLCLYNRDQLSQLASNCNFIGGELELDRDVANVWWDDPCINLRLGSRVTTSFGFYVRKADYV